jgi:hypothetical protein
MTRYTQNVREVSAPTKIGFFGAEASRRGGVGSFPWPILAELGQLSQPGWYGQHNTGNLQEFVYMLQMEKRALGDGPAAPRLIPVSSLLVY